MILFFISSAMLLFLLMRIGYLQLVMTEEYEARSERNRMRFVPVPAYRGEIYDRRFSEKLIANRKLLCVTAIPIALPRDADKKAVVIERIASTLEMTTNEIQRLLNKDSWDQYSPKLLKEDVDYQTITRIAESIDLYPGVYWENRPIRVYTLTNTLAHILGYTGYISEQELKAFAGRGYRSGSLIGKTGIERIYDMDLRGEEGLLERVVDARNRVTLQTVRQQPVHGRPMILTIDSAMQRVAQEAMGKMRGAVIVTRPATGEVLAILSNPGYAANLFYKRLEVEEYRRIESDPDKPLFNRVIQAQYPASSVFKIITAIAGLESGRMSEETTHFCDGGHLLGDRYFRCWFGSHRRQGLYDGIMNSCNVYFYLSGLDIGMETIVHYAGMFGLGRKTGIDLMGEASGFIPTREWKRKVAGRPWLDGDTLNLSIGQGDILVTPVQINMLTCALYNEGIVYQPYLKKEVRSLNNDHVIERNEGRHVLFTTDVSKNTFTVVKEGMRRVVQDGTGRAARSPAVVVAGKTGTAETSQDTTHAWFTGYAPADAKNPEDVIAVTVVCEDAGGGGAMAAPVVACIIRAHFENKTIDETMRDIWGSYNAQ
jgi:penicillin-binding protein 2